MPKYGAEVDAFLEDAQSFLKTRDQARLTPLHCAFILLKEGKGGYSASAPRRAEFEAMLDERLNRLPRGGPTGTDPMLQRLLDLPAPVTSLKELANRVLPSALRWFLPSFSPPSTLGVEGLADRVWHTLQAPPGWSAVVYGPPGSGRTNFLRVMTERRGLPSIPFPMDQVLDPMVPREEAYKTVQKLAEEARDSGKTVVIDDLHALAGVWAFDARRDVLSLLDPLLYGGGVQVLAASSADHATGVLARHPIWSKRARLFALPILEGNLLRQACAAHAELLEEAFGQSISPAVLEEAIQAAPNLLPDRAAPGGAVDLLDLGLGFQSGPGMDLAAFRGMISCFHPQPARTAIQTLEKDLNACVFGQEKAVGRIVDRLRLTRESLDAHPQRPDGVFLFLGPSGVGKTETARVLARLLHGDPSAFVKLDMSEFMEPHTVARLIGAPPGYVGFDAGSSFSRVMQGGSDKVILLDEVEKAHPRVLLLFLQVFDEGVLTDAQGVRMQFEHAIFILTSNLGRELWGGDRARHVGFLSQADRRDQGAVNEALLRILPPEFMNRLDEIILFDALEEAHLLQIVRHHLARATAQLSSRYSTRFTFDDAMVRWLAEKDYEPAFGARHVVRNVEKFVIGRAVEDAAAGALTAGIPVTLTPEWAERRGGR